MNRVPDINSMAKVMNSITNRNLSKKFMFSELIKTGKSRQGIN